jgi:hypothetical protein
MSREAFNTLTQEDMRHMIFRDIEQNKSIYPPSGPPDPRLRVLFGEVFSKDRTVDMTTSKILKIDVTMMLDMEPLSGIGPELVVGMKNILLHDGQRRLSSFKIRVDESSYQEDPARLFYSCTKSYRSRIKKFILEFNAEAKP